MGSRTYLRASSRNNNNNRSPSPNTPSPSPSPAPQTIPGLSELLILVKTIAYTPVGQEAVVDPKTLKALEASPLGPVYSQLKPIILRLSIAEAAVEVQSPWTRTSGNGHNEAVEQLKSLEGKMDAMRDRNENGFKSIVREKGLEATAQALGAKIAACQQDTVTALTTSTQSTIQHLTTVQDEVKAVPDVVKHQITTVNTHVAELRIELLENANTRIQKLEAKNEALEHELADLHKDLDAATTALVPVAFALDCAVAGEFPSLRDARAACVGELLDKTPVDIAGLAAAVQDDTFKLLSSCQALFSVVEPTTVSDTLAIGGGFEERWCSAIESALAWHAQLQDSHESVESKAQEAEAHRNQLMLFGYLVDQVRDGQYVLEDWTEATKRPEYAEYMNGSFDGFDALQTVAEEMHRLKQTNAKLKRRSLSASASGRAAKSGWSALD